MPKMSHFRTTPSEENYLEWIFRMANEGAVRPAMLAEKIGVSRPSASRAVLSLKKKGLVLHEAYGEIRLTKAGAALGEAIVRRDECLTALLVDVLGMSPETADPEVHRMEHVLSDDVLRRLEVLVAFSQTSDAWIRRLQYRIGTALNKAGEKEPVQAGSSDIHPGNPCEKQPAPHSIKSAAKP
jgi:DtxR family transcriptional regulator, Mn-dependent transcriptional regulator